MTRSVLPLGCAAALLLSCTAIPPRVAWDGPSRFSEAVTASEAARTRLGPAPSLPIDSGQGIRGPNQSFDEADRREGGPNADEAGVILIRVRWPEAADRRTLGMPDDTKAIRVEVLDPADRVVTSQTAVRPETGEMSILKLTVDAGSYCVRAQAFDAPDPGLDAVPVAIGDASNIEVRSSRTSQVGLELRPPTDPAIRRLVPGNGGPGTRVVLKGRNFGVAKGLSLAVNFAGIPSGQVQAFDDSAIEAEVPPGAVSGNVSVVVGGIESGSTSPFLVVGLLRLLPLPGDLLAGLGMKVPLEARDTAGKGVTSPFVRFSVEPAGIATVSPNWDLISLGSGSSTVSVTVRSGNIVASRSYPILSRPLSVTISPATATINALAADGINDPGFVSTLQFEALVTYSDAATNSAVSWTSSDTTLCTVSETGLAAALANAAAGVVRIQASSIRNPAIKDTATITVETLGEGVMIVE